MTRGLTLAILILVGAPSLGWAAGSVRVPAEISLEDRILTLGRIAIFDDVPAELAAELQALSLGPAAEPAEQRVLGGSALRARIHAIAPELRLSVPDTITVRRAHSEVTPEWVQARVSEALARKQPWREAKVGFSSWRLPPRFSVPANATSLRVRFGRGEDFVGRVSAELEFFDPREPDVTETRRSVTVEVSVRRPVVVAARDLRRGQRPDAGQLRSELLDLRSVPNDALLDPALAIGQALRVHVQAGSPILTTYLDAPALVRRGDPIEVDAGAPGLEVRIAARALEPGRLGEVIRAENPSSRKSFAVKLTGPGSAVLARGGKTR